MREEGREDNSRNEDESVRSRQVLPKTDDRACMALREEEENFFPFSSSFSSRRDVWCFYVSSRAVGFSLFSLLSPYNR
jgi:hypothetical protein